jgi:hypothetical protein
MTIRSVLFLLIVVGLALPATASAQALHQRDTWYIGFGLGGGLAAQWHVDGQTITFDDWLAGTDKGPKVSLNFKVGGTMSPQTLVGFDLTAVAQSGTLSGLDATTVITNYFAMLTHFPNQEGLFVRVGGGMSRLTNMVDTPSGTISDDATGFGLLGGIGYAFWLGKSFNLTLNMDQSYQWYSSSPGNPDKSQFTILYVGFDWY